MRSVAQLVRFGYAPHKSLVRVPQTLGSLEVYMIVNFKFCRISRDTHKLARTPTLILKIKNKAHKLYNKC